MVHVLEKKSGECLEERVEDINSINQTTPCPTKIQKFFESRCVFVTGATGYIGKLLVEKLIWTCPDVRKIYVLVREKKEKSVEKRFQENVLDSIVFDRIRRSRPESFKKIVPVSGDCDAVDLGLSEEDRQKLINDVNCVFHCAATVRFDQKIRTATHTNVRATRDLLNLSREMKDLRALVYVSTAYSNCVREDVDEKFYDPKVDGNNFIKVADLLNENVLNELTTTLIGDWPNTYVFTKSLSEDVVRTQTKNLPVAIVRPSIVIATAKEPVAGWIDNLYGATGVLMGAAVGLIRTLHCKADNLADLVPADFVVNCSIAAAWDIENRRLDISHKEITANETTDNSKTKDPDIQIYNVVCSPQKPITWRRFMRLAEKHLKAVPSPVCIWHYCFFLVPSQFLNMLCLFFLHRVPAYSIDFMLRCIRKEPMLVKGYQRIDKFLDVLAYFATRQWKFSNDNTQALWKRLDRADQNLFDFDFDKFDWETFFYTYARGGRVYLLKDPMETLPQGRIKYLKLQIAHYTLVTILVLMFLQMLYIFWKMLL